MTSIFYHNVDPIEKKVFERWIDDICPGYVIYAFARSIQLIYAITNLMFFRVTYKVGKYNYY